MTFRARPPTVLYKEPFVPKKVEQPLTEITAFELNTDRRAREREAFEQHMKQKEEQIAEFRKKVKRFFSLQLLRRFKEIMCLTFSIQIVNETKHSKLLSLRIF